MAGLPYRKDARPAPSRRPRAKLPYIDDAGERIVPTSTFIRAHLERTYGVDLDAGLSARQRAEAWAIERMIEDHLGWASAYFRWIVPENFAAARRTFSTMPRRPCARACARRSQARIADRLFGQGMGRHSHEEIAELGTRTLWSLAAILGDKPYLMGDRPTAVDATALGMLAGLLAPVFRSPLREMVEDTDNLALYTARMMRRFYPEFVWEPGEQVRLSRLARPRERIDAELAPLG